MLIRRPEAEQDLIDIYLYVSRDNPAAAEKLVRAIDAKCERLARSPMIGSARPELRPDLRSVPFGAYLILYRVIDDGAEIVRVVPRRPQSRRSCLMCAPIGEEPHVTPRSGTPFPSLARRERRPDTR